MIINNLPKSIVLNGSIEDKHININKLSANVIKLDNNFSILDDGSLSINIKLLNKKPTTIEDNFIYLVSENSIINSLSNADKEKIDKLIINNNGSKFLSNDGTYKTLYPFIKIYYNFTDFSSNDLLTIFNEMDYPSILYAEINDNSYPSNIGHLTITKISENTANVIYNGINQHIYTRTINNNQVSDWLDISCADTAKKLENVIYINKAKFDGSQSITSSEMNLATGNDSIIEFDSLEENTWVRLAESNNNLAIGSFLVNVISNNLSFNLKFDISFNDKIYFSQRLYDYNENSQIRITYDNNKCYIDLKIIKNITNGEIKIHSYTNDFNLLNSLSVNNTLNNNTEIFDLMIQSKLLTFIKTLSLNDNWIDTDISNLNDGSYVIQLIFINEKIMFTGYFSWYNNTNILNDKNEIILHKSSDNNNNISIYLRTIQDTSTRLQISSNNEISNATIQFKIKQILWHQNHFWGWWNVLTNKNTSLNKIVINGHSVKNSEVTKFHKEIKKTNSSNFNTTSTTVIIKKPKEEQNNIVINNNIVKENNIFNFDNLKNECIKICRDKSQNDLIKLINTTNNLEELLYYFINYILPIL